MTSYSKARNLMMRKSGRYLALIAIIISSIVLFKLKDKYPELIDIPRALGKDFAMKQINIGVITSSMPEDYRIPIDDKLAQMNASELMQIYWKYINMLQVLCKNVIRVGSLKDGGKEICIDNDFKPKSPCIVYSFGMSRQMYDKTALENAVRAVTNKSMGYLKASKLYNVPRSTIFDKVKGHSSIECTMGPHTILTKTEEKRIVDWLTQMSRIGYGRTKYELIRTVANIVKVDGRKTPFKGGVPGKDWYYAFMDRHPDIKLRSPRQLGKERAVITPERVEEWFHDFREYINEVVEDKTILLDPTRMYNVDESGFSLAVKTGHVLGVRGAKSVYSVSASDKSQITVLCGMSAAAHFLRPMIVFSGQRFTRNMLEGFDGAVLGRSSNGWMESELFASWLETIFIPDIEERQVKKPLILLVDGHSTHLTLEACDICRDNDIILYCLLEHASHLMQPCDLRFFCSLKESWKTALRDWQIEHVGEYVTKFEFARIFKHAWVASTRVENAVNGFRDAGLFPLDSSMVFNTDKFQTCVLFHKRKMEESQSKKIDETEKESSQTENVKDNESSQAVEVTRTVDHETETSEDTEVTETNASQVRPSIASTSQSESLNQPTELSRTGGNDPCSSKAESPLSKFLKIPTIKMLEKKKSKKVLLPKAVTSEKFREYLIEMKTRKEEEEKAKLLRKEERERKRKEKEEAKKVKDEEKLQKKKEQEGHDGPINAHQEKRIGYKYDFDNAIVDLFGCNVYCFDPSMNKPTHQISENMWFYNVGLGGENFRNDKHWEIKTLDTIRRDFGHTNRTIDILKIDIEGSEWYTIPQMISSGALSGVQQIAIELHFNSKAEKRVEQYQKLSALRQLYDYGFRIFMRERNTHMAQQTWPGIYGNVLAVNEISMIKLSS